MAAISPGAAAWFTAPDGGNGFTFSNWAAAGNIRCCGRHQITMGALALLPGDGAWSLGRRR